MRKNSSKTHVRRVSERLPHFSRGSHKDAVLGLLSRRASHTLELMVEGRVVTKKKKKKDTLS